MNVKENILKDEIEFPKLFTSYEEKEYGIIFYNENAKESHDSNHAVLFPEKISNFEKTITDIKKFYLDKGITPRIYQPFIKNYFADHKKELEKQGYKIKIYGNSKFMLLTEKNTIPKHTRLHIKHILEWDERLADEIYIPAGEEYEIEVEKNSLKNRDYFLFAGFLDEKIVSIFSFHTSNNHCTRFDGLLVRKDQRNKGYAKEIVGFVIDFCKEKNYENIYLWPANDTAEHIYFSAGFRVQFEEEAGSAIYCQ